jgi:putative ABC transport system ATP-binding protein
MKSPIIRAEGLSKSFKNDRVVTSVIRDLDLSIDKGSFTVIMGNSGSGKSTLLYLLCGLDKVSSGKIWIDDIPVHGRSERDLALLRRSSIGFVFQDNNLVPNLTIRENILVAGYLVNKDRKLLNQRASALLEDLDILPLADRLPSQASGGELQKCAIARALINNPLVVLADEPTGSLNSEASSRVLDCLSRLHQNGQSIVMVTHELKCASRGERILFFKDGAITGQRFKVQNADAAIEEEEMHLWLKEKGW